MPDTGSRLKTLFTFGDIEVQIVYGDIVDPGVPAEALVSTDDNYMTMGAGVAAALRKLAGTIEYVREAQRDCPVHAGSVVVTRSYKLKDLLGVDYVLHGAVIDYDSDRLSLADLVEQTTTNCLQKAEALGLQSIVFPAFASGKGKLSMEESARRMCGAIKAYVGCERPIKHIYIILHRPTDPSKLARYRAKNERFVREANLLLGVPYDPSSRVRQVRDFYGADEALQKLEQIIAGQCDDENGKRHAVILGGPFSGKWALLDHLDYRARQPGSPLSQGRRLVKLTFGRVHESTPASFVYRKFLCALGEAETDNSPQTKALLRQLRRAYSDPKLDCDRFLAFLDRYPDRYGEVVFLIDKLPRLLRMEASDPQEPTGVQAFWKDLDKLQRHLRFVYTARPADYKQLREQRLDPYASDFQSRIETIVLACITDKEREKWVNDLFSRYLDRAKGAPRFVQQRFEEEAGRHPYLISLFGYALIAALKRDQLGNPNHPARYTKSFMARFFREACRAIEQTRRTFFEVLIGVANPAELENLENLAKAVTIEQERKELMPGLAKGDARAIERLKGMQELGDPRKLLDKDTLRWLEVQGYLVDVDKKAQFVASSFAAWVANYFGVSRPAAKGAPTDVEVSLLQVTDDQNRPAIRTLFQGRGARIITALKELHPEDKRSFTEALSQCINHLLHPDKYPEAGWLHNPEEIGNFILTQFATTEIKSYLRDPPSECTICFEIDEALKDIPWELMLETAYAGRIPFRVGRRVIGQRPAMISPAKDEPTKIKALLIGNPTGDLDDAQAEVEQLAERLRSDDDRFEEPKVLLGADCQPGPILSALSSRQYGLIHYSGHSKFDGYRSAWLLANGQMLTTDRLTSALQMGPPAFVFSSSCQSAVGEEPQPIQYENQTFDLPSAFLQAGVEAYVGTLWEVEARAALLFVDDFYEALLSGEHNLGECLRRAKWARKQDESYDDTINWLSFILYGDPHLKPGDLFPVMA